MAKVDPHVAAHLEWLGFVRPTGLVVSAPALVRAGATVNQRDTEGQRRLRACTDGADGPSPILPDFEVFAREVLGWALTPKYYAGTEGRPIPDSLEVTLPDFGESLRPTLAVAEPRAKDDNSPWQLLVRVEPQGRDLDVPFTPPGSSLEAAPHGRMERLLRQTGVPAGLLFNGRVIRLVSAPRGESSGWLDFRLEDMLQTAGRPICAAMRLLLSQHRLLAAGDGKRLAALLEDSRKFQNEVSERLAGQVLHALYELLRGFQAANDAAKGALLREVLSEHPDQVYRGLLTVLLRLVFLLYAEERDMLPEDETFLKYYSVAGLHERLREDAALNPDTMDQRYGAWVQLMALFRMVHDGARWGDTALPERHGVLFDPDRFPFLEGRPVAGARQIHEAVEVPLVPDGTIYRALEKLLVLDGERISYRALDVEQIGSVYETMMGFRLETATGRSVAIKAAKKHGAPTTVDLDALLAEDPGKRAKWLQDRADRKLPASASRGVKDAETLEDLHAALEKIADSAATPDLVPKGAMVLQPSEERRRSGSHYTPRELTEPIVRTTLRPILERLREEADGPPTAEQILDLKVCDPAMGSGAFLVEACRQLGDTLLEVWRVHGGMPPVPPDEDEVIFARRMVAQRCLYGVDRNPVAVDLAKVSLWLITLAREHPFTFLDHALRHGDSLVGLSMKQIAAFNWDVGKPGSKLTFEQAESDEHLQRATDFRDRIRSAGEEVTDQELRRLWDDAETEMSQVRLFGDLVVAAFFDGETEQDRREKLGEFADAVATRDTGRYQAWLRTIREADPPLAPFHWEIEFPEVFECDEPGFDAFVGNPPFAGVTSLSTSNLTSYTDWLRQATEGTGGKCDLVAFFFRLAFSRLRRSGTMGLIATKTIAQGDTRRSGLLPIVKRGGTIYEARRRLAWPGQAAVIVSVVHVTKGSPKGSPTLDGRAVGRISAFLLDSVFDDDPISLRENAEVGYLGSKTQAIGFVVQPNKAGCPSPDEVAEILLQEPQAAKFVRGYVGGEHLTGMVEPGYPLRVIDFGSLRQEDVERFPALLGLVREYVWPSRRSKRGALKDRWWQFGHRAKELYAALEGLSRFIATPRNSDSFAFTMMPVGGVVNDKVVAFPFESYAAFSALQCRVHEVWARTFSTTLKDDLQYTPSDCLVSFPFIRGSFEDPVLEASGHEYYEFRGGLMEREKEGLTKTYNRFHNPEERSADIAKLRDLHAAMDRAVLDGYGWVDIPTDCEFLLDYEEEDDEDSRRKKPWRYRWPDEVHDEVLARLLELNAERAKEERLAGGAVTGAKASTGRVREEGTDYDLNHDLFDE